MKKKLFGGLMALCLVIFAGCAAAGELVDASVYEKIHRELVNMHSFTAQATVTYISNNSTHVYETIQFARKSGEYRIEVTAPTAVAGNTTIFDGTTISQFNPRLDGRITQTNEEAPERLEILLTSFVRNFLRSQEVSVVASSLDETLTTVLEAPIPGEHPYLSTSRLWMCNETLLPKQLTIYDNAGIERVIVVYNNFEFNAQIEDSMFHTWHVINQ